MTPKLLINDCGDYSLNGGKVCSCDALNIV